MEPGGGHPDHRHGVVVDEDLAADDIGAPPNSACQKSYESTTTGPAPERSIVCGLDYAAERGADAQHREIAAGDDLGGNRPGIAAGRRD